MGDFLLEKPLDIARYQFRVRADELVKLAPFIGSTLRGSLGHSLRSIACMTGQRNCQGCSLINSCHYPSLFEPSLQAGLSARYATPPPPYVLEAPMGRPRKLAKGDIFSFNMVLFGGAIAQLPLLVWAWQRAMMAGLGSGRGRCHLQSVSLQQPDDQWQIVFNALDKAVQTHEAMLSMAIESPAISALQMTLETPTRIQTQGRMLNSCDLDARSFLTALYRKVSLYLRVHCEAELPPPPSTDHIELKANNLTVHKWKRYSTRQQDAIALDGLLGKFTLRGEIAPWLPWLRLGQYTHVGKNTSFGLGQYKLNTRLNTKL